MRAPFARLARAAACVCVAVPVMAGAQSAALPGAAEFHEGDHWVWRRTDDLTHIESTFESTVHKVDGAAWIRSARADRPVAQSYVAGTGGGQDPAKPWRVWPLEVGRQWEYFFTWDNGSGAGSTSEDIVVKAYEEVEVPAGKFMAYRIEATGPWRMTSAATHQGFSGTVNETSWYAPAALTHVKVVYRTKGNQWTNELVSFTRGPD